MSSKSNRKYYKRSKSLKNAHNKELCENELEEENSKYLQHCFPQGLVDKIASPQDEDNVYFERGYTRRSLESAQCNRRKSSSGSDDTSSSSVLNRKLTKHSKKLGLGLPPKHAKRFYKLTHGRFGEGTSSSYEKTLEKESRRHSVGRTLNDLRMDHRGNLEKYNKFDEMVAKGRYKKLEHDLDSFDQSMSKSDARKLSLAQQVLGLADEEEELQKRPSSSTKENRSGSSSKSPSVPKSSKTIDKTQSPLVNLFPSDNKLSSNTNWTYHSTVDNPVKKDRQGLLLDLPPNTFHLTVPTTNDDNVTSVSVLSYSAPTTPMNPGSCLFPPLAVDVSTASHRTSLSLEPLPSFGLSEGNPSRPLTKVTLSLRPSSDEAKSPVESSSPGLTYTSYSKDGVQAQLHISIGSNMSHPQHPISQESMDSLESSPPPELPPSLPTQISENTKSILSAQLKRKAMLVNALMCEKERLISIKRDVASMEDKLRLMLTSKTPNSSKLSKLRHEVKVLQEEVSVMSNALDKNTASKVSSPESDEAFYEHIYTGQKILPFSHLKKSSYPGTESVEQQEKGWICYMCTFENHPMLPKCEQCEMLRVNLDNNNPGLPSLYCT